MTPRTVFTLCLLLSPFLAFSQYETQYFDGKDTIPEYTLQIDIEPDSANIWQIGKPQKTIFHRAATLPHAIVTDTANLYPPNNTSRFSFGVKSDSWGWGIWAIEWIQKIDMESGQDGGIIEFSSDSGQSWQNVFNNPYVYSFYGFDQANADTLPDGTFAFSGTDTLWRNIWLCFDVSWLNFNDSVIFRFTFRSDGKNGPGEGWLIDNFSSHATFIHTLNQSKQSEYLEVKPNPTSGRVYIETQKLNEYHIIEKMELMDMHGKIVQRFGTSPTKFHIDIGQYPAGIYFLKVKTNLHEEIFRILLQHE